MENRLAREIAEAINRNTRELEKIRRMMEADRRKRSTINESTIPTYEDGPSGPIDPR